MEHKRYCNRQIFYLISSLRGVQRWLPHNRVHARVPPLGPIHHSDLEPEQAPGEQEKATGTRDRREIYMKIERRLDQCVLHKIDVSRIIRGDIFILRHVSARLARVQRSRRAAINHFAWSYILIKGKPFLHPNDGVFFAIKKRTHARNLLETFMKAAYAICTSVRPRQRAPRYFCWNQIWGCWDK